MSIILRILCGKSNSCSVGPAAAKVKHSDVSAAKNITRGGQPTNHPSQSAAEFTYDSFESIIVSVQSDLQIRCIGLPEQVDNQERNPKGTRCLSHVGRERIGYARCSTDRQYQTAQRQDLAGLGVTHLHGPGIPVGLPPSLLNHREIRQDHNEQNGAQHRTSNPKGQHRKRQASLCTGHRPLTRHPRLDKRATHLPFPAARLRVAPFRRQSRLQYGTAPEFRRASSWLQYRQLRPRPRCAKGDALGFLAYLSAQFRRARSKFS